MEIAIWSDENDNPLAVIYDDAVPREGDSIHWQLGADVAGGPSMHFGTVHSVSWILQVGKIPASYLRCDVIIKEG